MLRDAEKNLGNIMEMGDEAHTNMREANLDLQGQRHILQTLFYYDEDLKVYINKATNKVSYLESKTFTKKILLVSLVLLLGIILVATLILKVFMN